MMKAMVGSLHTLKQVLAEFGTLNLELT